MLNFHFVKIAMKCIRGDLNTWHSNFNMLRTPLIPIIGLFMQGLYVPDFVEHLHSLILVIAYSEVVIYQRGVLG